MEEREFLILADAEMARLEAVLERLLDTGAVDFDVEAKPGGIVELVFADDSKIIINRHAAAREIWVAARSGGYHFAPPEQSPGPWRGTRDGERLPDVLSRCFSAQAGMTVGLDW